MQDPITGPLNPVHARNELATLRSRRESDPEAEKVIRAKLATAKIQDRQGDPRGDGRLPRPASPGAGRLPRRPGRARRAGGRLMGKKSRPRQSRTRSRMLAEASIQREIAERVASEEPDMTERLAALAEHFNGDDEARRG
jgi:hypothetical protein